MTSVKTALTLSILSISALAAPPDISHAELVAERGLGDKSYAPYKVDCPTNVTWVRNATTGLGDGEKAFQEARQELVQPAIEKMMAARGLDNPPRTPIIGVALAGGGYRAMLTGLGGVMGMMNESTEAQDSGTGGWLEGTSYWAGLSGGSWATGSFMANGGQLPTDLLTNLWDMSSNLVFPDSGKLTFYPELYQETNAKSDQGFPIQITDIWGLAVGKHVLPEEYQLSNNPNLTFSSLPSVVGALGNASLPMPIIIAAERESGELVIAENATVYEFTPYEFGSWAFGSDYKAPGAFTPLEYLGSEVNNGSSNGTCWKGFDQLSFIMGTSATLFNSIFLSVNSSESSLLNSLCLSILGELGEDNLDISRIPNSFANYNSDENPVSDFEYLTLIDAGETNQNVPLEPLIAPARAVDAIVAFDSSYDTTYIWPNGTALRTTYERAQVLAEHENVKVRMPEIPSEAGMINGGYNTRPTFFGCNDTSTPVIIYIPSYPWSYAANTSTYKLAYDNDVAEGVMLNAMRSLTLNNTVETWPTCFACALTDRAFDYTSSNRSSECQSCFDTWCWAGDDNTTDPGTYEPEIGSVPPWLLAQGLSTGVADAPDTNSSSSSSSDGDSGDAGSTSSGAEKLGAGLSLVLLASVVGFLL
ncbi:phospholipase B [Cryptococcus amylolentus CBS 6273]|uniref:Lysophospholipase n=1 Tax=Cryptococcus amylolentus CBS 6273 TaxID=1296118 RepID=A0A1E3JYA5_9TREE|nr:phospholipase B [Cryptococcus amylolentus CBS 6273]